MVYRIKEQYIRNVTLVEVNEQDRSRRRVQFWEIMNVTSVRMLFEMTISLREDFELCIAIEETCFWLLLSVIFAK